MVVIEFTEFGEASFCNDRGKREWYGSDYDKGGRIEVRDIVSANEKFIHCIGLDHETVELPVTKIRIVRCSQ